VRKIDDFLHCTLTSRDRHTIAHAFGWAAHFWVRYWWGGLGWRFPHLRCPCSPEWRRNYVWKTKNQPLGSPELRMATLKRRFLAIGSHSHELQLRSVWDRRSQPLRPAREWMLPTRQVGSTFESRFHWQLLCKGLLCKSQPENRC
jgi:hypothetical protein